MPITLDADQTIYHPVQMVLDVAASYDGEPLRVRISTEALQDISRSHATTPQELVTTLKAHLVAMADIATRKFELGAVDEDGNLTLTDHDVN